MERKAARCPARPAALPWVRACPRERAAGHGLFRDAGV